MSTVRANTISDAAGTGPAALTGQFAAKAYVQYEGDGSAINNSLNVSSLDDNGTGDATTNFTNNFADANYAYAGGCHSEATGGLNQLSTINADAPTASAFIAQVSDIGGTVRDPANAGIHFMGDLA